jgi:flagellar basal-body rod modification protein FlgD
VQAANSRIEPSFIGKNVEAITPVIGLKGGSAQFDLILDRASAATSMTILNVNGQVVRNFAGPTDSGRTTLTWDGTDNNGNALPDGPYFVQPQAVDAEGATIQAQTVVTAPVKEVRFGLEGESSFVLEHDAVISEDELVSVKQ